MSMEQNQLTRDLYAAGYTREDHPSFVYWSDWQNFGYLFEALLKFTWETPCGLLVDGKSDLGRGLACSDASFQGIDYCPENDNPLLRCPYERKDCPHSISGFPVPLCPCHTTGTLLRLSRAITNAFYTNAEKYDQDSYGRTILSKPLPLLFPTIKLSRLDKDTLEYRLLYTQMLRNRNRVADAVLTACEYAELFLAQK